MHLDPSLTERLFAELVLTAQAAERRFRPYVGELGADPMVFRSFGEFGRWQEIPHPSRFVRERSEDGDASASCTPAWSRPTPTSRPCGRSA
jgi:hypothetical protein